MWDIKQAIRQLGLGTNHARLIQQLNAKKLEVSEKKALEIRQNAINQVFAEKLSIIETRALIKSVIAKYNPSQKSKSQSRSIEFLIRDMSDISVENVETEQLEKLLITLEAKVKEIRNTLA